MEPRPSPSIISALREGGVSSREAPASYEEEVRSLERQADLDIKLQHLQTLKDNNQARKEYAKKIFAITLAWTFAIFVIVILTGLGLFYLSDAVLITLIGTTTINFFGFFLLVVKYLFSIQGLPYLNNQNHTEE